MKMQSIQLLRAISALFVVGAHLPRLEHKFFSHGLLHGIGAATAIGVDLFFVISGFIMITTVWKTFGTANAPSNFLIRRFIRIYPAYWIAFVAFLGAGLLFPAIEHVAPITPSVLLTSAFLVPYGSFPIMVVAWSLEYELYFYLVFALALYVGKSRLPLLLGGWSAATLLLNVASHYTTNYVVGFLGSPLSFEFMGGLVVGYFVLHRRVFAPLPLLIIGLVAALSVAIFSIRLNNGFATPDLAWFRVLAAGPAMLLIVYGIVTLEAQNKFTPHTSLVHVGNASYSMYLWHGMLLGVFGVVFGRLHFLHGVLANIAYIAGAFTFVTFGSLLVYRLVESPSRNMLKSLLNPGAPVLSGVKAVQ